MSYNDIPANKGRPDDFFTVVETPANHSPIKYVVDEASGQVFVDQFLSTPMFYPANHGFIPNTAGSDGKPLAVLVITPYPLSPGVVIRSRPVGVMYTTDDAGPNTKLIAVPHDMLSGLYTDVKECHDLPALLLTQIQHFFEKHKTLETGTNIKMERWGSAEEAREHIRKSVAA